MKEDKHEINSVEEYEYMIEAQKFTIVNNAISCGIFSAFCVTDACAFLHTNNLFMLVMSGLTGAIGAKHYLYLKDGKELIKEYKEKIKELKK